MKDTSLTRSTSNANEDEIDPILKESNKRFILFPIEHHEVWKMYCKAKASHWDVDEIDLSNDMNDWNLKLNDNERYFIKMVLAFFAASDGIVNENLAMRFYNDVKIPEARYKSLILW